MDELRPDAGSLQIRASGGQHEKNLKERELKWQPGEVHYFRCHEDAPDCEDGHEFNCLIMEYTDWGHENSQRSDLRLTAQMQGGAAAAIVPAFLAQSQSLGQVASPGPAGQPPGDSAEQKAEREKKEEEKKEKKREKERLKELPISKCKAWATAMQKDRKKADELVDNIGNATGVPKPTCTDFIKKFRAHAKAMAEMDKKLSNVTERDAIKLLEEAKRVVQDFKDENRKWSNTLRIHTS